MRKPVEIREALDEPPRAPTVLDPRNPNAPPRTVTLREAPMTESPTPYDGATDPEVFEDADARERADLTRTASTAAPKLPGETDAQYFERRRRVALEERMSDGRGALIAVGGVLYARLPDLRRGALDDAWSAPEVDDGDPCG